MAGEEPVVGISEITESEDDGLKENETELTKKKIKVYTATAEEVARFSGEQDITAHNLGQEKVVKSGHVGAENLGLDLKESDSLKVLTTFLTSIPDESKPAVFVCLAAFLYFMATLDSFKYLVGFTAVGVAFNYLVKRNTKNSSEQVLQNINNDNNALAMNIYEKGGEIYKHSVTESKELHIHALALRGKCAGFQEAMHKVDAEKDVKLAQLQTTEKKSEHHLQSLILDAEVKMQNKAVDSQQAVAIDLAQNAKIVQLAKEETERQNSKLETDKSIANEAQVTAREICRQDANKSVAMAKEKNITDRVLIEADRQKSEGLCSVAKKGIEKGVKYSVKLDSSRTNTQSCLLL